jgi:hemolysin III
MTVTETSPRRTRLVALEDRPRLRGWLHMVCFFVAIPAGAWVIFEASSPRARVGAVIYAVGLVALFGVSGSYHRLRWGPTWRWRMKCLDHATIFVMIAGSYTPLCLVALRGWTAVVLLIVAWSGAIAGGVLSWQKGRRSSLARSVLYIALGWVVLLASPQMLTRIDPMPLVLIAIGGFLFTIGAITLAARWPDPFPRVFGYHEIWHVFVVAAVVCHLIAISSVLHATGA